MLYLEWVISKYRHYEFSDRKFFDRKSRDFQRIFNLFVFTGQDTRIRFSLEPSGGDPGYNQWKDAMKMVARLPEGVPTDFRKKVHTILFIF